MNKELQVLHTIFELELNPPFRIDTITWPPTHPGIYDKYSEGVGWISKVNHEFVFSDQRMKSIFIKIKQVFNVNELSDDDVYHIAKHLYHWLPVEFLVKFDRVKFSNIDSGNTIYYPKK